MPAMSKGRMITSSRYSAGVSLRFDRTVTIFSRMEPVLFCQNVEYINVPNMEH
jgi:hypothetical protein